MKFRRIVMEGFIMDLDEPVQDEFLNALAVAG